MVLDHAIGLPLWCRRIVLFLGLSAGVAFAVLRIVLPLVGKVNGFYAARTIEEADPAFKNSLISYLDLRRRRDEISKAAMAAIEAKAVNDLTQVEIESVVNQRRLTQMAYALSGVVVVFCLYAALTPKSILDSARRALLADVVRPTNTRLVNIKPGDDPELSRVVAGSHVPFTVDYKGTRPDKIFLHYSVDGGKFFAKQELAPGANYYDPWRLTLRNVQQSVDYYLTGGRRRVAPLPPRSPPRADGDLGRARLRVPPLRQAPAAHERRGGQRRGDRGDARHRPRPDQPARAVGQARLLARPTASRSTWRWRPPTRTR